MSLLTLVSLASAALGWPSPVAALDAPPPSAPRPLATCEPDGTQASGAIYRICMPPGFPFSLPWNRDLVVYAHGYVAPGKPVGIPEDQLQLPDGTYIPDLVVLAGYAFATTSYSVNGLAVREGISDVVDLVNIFRMKQPMLDQAYLVGPSEGGLITTLAVEQYADVFDGGLALCGPVGDFTKQINYWSDFRVVFDYYFPGLMPGTAISIPQTLVDTWDAHYTNTILPVILNPANTITVTQLLSVTQVAYVPTDTTTISNTIYNLLWYNVIATNDATTRLGGQPFDNQGRVYSGSNDDAALNAGVQRFTAAPAAIAEIQAHYQTSGRPLVPLVTQHTTLDPVAPVWHEDLYRARVIARGMTPRHDDLRVDRYGHCNFQPGEVLAAFGVLQNRVMNPPPFKSFLPLLTR